MCKCIMILSALTPLLIAVFSNAKAETPGYAKTEAAFSTGAPSINCSAAYGGQASTCERIPCGPLYRPFIGTWSGQFHSYVRRLSSSVDRVYRPYHSVITYSKKSCLKNTGTGETLIIGRETNSYPAYKNLPAEVSTGLLITGRKTDGTLFLRTVSGKQVNDWSLAYMDTSLKLAVWKLRIPASAGKPRMTFTIIDGRDFSAANTHTRDVAVILTVGPNGSPYWSGAVSYGSHTLRH